MIIGAGADHLAMAEAYLSKAHAVAGPDEEMYAHLELCRAHAAIALVCATVDASYERMNPDVSARWRAAGGAT